MGLVRTLSQANHPWEGVGQVSVNRGLEAIQVFLWENTEGLVGGVIGC